jgi:serine/threonine protein kinase
MAYRQDLKASSSEDGHSIARGRMIRTMSGMSERIGRYELVAPRPGQENTFLARRRGAGAFERYVVVRVVDMSGETAGLLRLQADEVLWPLGHLHHQHLRNVIDVEEHADRLLIVTEYVHGCTVRDVLEGGAQLPYDFGLTVVAHVASALHHMHTRRRATASRSA